MIEMLPSLVIFHEWGERFLAEVRRALPELPVAIAPDLEALKQRLPEAEILLCRELPPAALPYAGRLRWIQLTSAGVDGMLPVRDHVRELKVTSARGIHAELMADHAMAAMVMLQWDFPRLLREQAAKQWNREPRRALAGQTLLVIGPGAIGGEIGRRAGHFGMHVLGVRRGTGPLPGFAEIFTSDRLDAVLPRADFVCVTAPATPETHHLMGAPQFAAMKRSAFFLNISRGALVDENALVAALQQGEIAGAALDVFEREPPADDSPLWAMPNVIMTPHISGMLDTNIERVIGVLADNLRRYRAGQPLRNLVDLARGY